MSTSETGLAGRGLRVLMGTAILDLNDGRGFSMGIWNDRNSSSSSSCSRRWGDEGAARKKPLFLVLSVGKAGHMLSTNTEESMSATLLGGGGQDDMTSIKWADDCLGVER